MRQDYLDALLSLFQARPAGKERWKAKCPAHQDRTPSLSLWLGRDGRLMIGCWAGCDKRDVLAKVGLVMADLFGPKDADGQRDRQRLRRVVEQVFDYRDEAGNLLYQVLRWKPKSFSQRRPDPQRRGRWVSGRGCLDGVRKVLFHLQALRAASPKRTVFLPEGERKVLALERLGLVATCNAGGAESWLDTYALDLCGRHVAILPDNDAPGWKFACLKAGSLLRHGAASVRLVELPGLGAGGDVVDYLGAGGTREGIEAALRSAVQWLGVDRRRKGNS